MRQPTGGMGRTLCQPTFAQFVAHVIEEHQLGREANEHWAPIYNFCSPCQVHFDVVMHFETLKTDEIYLVEMVSKCVCVCVCV